MTTDEEWDNLERTSDTYIRKKTDLIFDLTCPFDNPYQGHATRILFVCSVGMLRSPTAALVATQHGYNARSCGSWNDLSLIPITANLVTWANKIVFMNQKNKDEALEIFKDNCIIIRKIQSGVVWNIADHYDYNHPTLRMVCEEKLEELFK